MRVRIIIPVLALFMLACVVSAKGQTRCVWGAECDVIGHCQGADQAIGCDSAGGCNNCYRADVQLQQMTSSFNEVTQFAGQFTRERSPRFKVTIPGPLTKHGVEIGWIIKRINGYKPTPRRFVNWQHRNHAPLRIVAYKPGSRKLLTFTAK